MSNPKRRQWYILKADIDNCIANYVPAYRYVDAPDDDVITASEVFSDDAVLCSKVRALCDRILNASPLEFQQVVKKDLESMALEIGHFDQILNAKHET